MCDLCSLDRLSLCHLSRQCPHTACPPAAKFRLPVQVFILRQARLFKAVCLWLACEGLSHELAFMSPFNLRLSSPRSIQSDWAAQFPAPHLAQSSPPEASQPPPPLLQPQHADADAGTASLHGWPRQPPSADGCQVSGMHTASCVKGRTRWSLH